MVEAIVLRGVHGVELVDLHKVQAGQVGLPRRVDTTLFEYLSRLGRFPFGE